MEQLRDNHCYLSEAFSSSLFFYDINQNWSNIVSSFVVILTRWFTCL